VLLTDERVEFVRPVLAGNYLIQGTLGGRRSLLRCVKPES
jgi:hypothetical protein